MSAYDLGCVKTQKFEKRRELFSQIKQKRTRSRIPAAIIAIQKNVHSIAVARRYVFTQPRPKADIVNSARPLKCALEGTAIKMTAGIAVCFLVQVILLQ